MFDKKIPLSHPTLKITLFLFAAVLISGCGSEKRAADLVLLNGKIATLDSTNPLVEGVAVYGNKIREVGPSGQMRDHVGGETEVVDLHGALALPGFIDNHTHFNRAGALLLGVNLLEVSDTRGLIREVKAAVDRMPEGSWLRSGDWGAYEQWAKESEGKTTKGTLKKR